VSVYDDQAAAGYGVRISHAGTAVNPLTGQSETIYARMSPDTRDAGGDQVADWTDFRFASDPRGITPQHQSLYGWAPGRYGDSQGTTGVEIAVIAGLAAMTGAALGAAFGAAAAAEGAGAGAAEGATAGATEGATVGAAEAGEGAAFYGGADSGAVAGADYGAVEVGAANIEEAGMADLLGLSTPEDIVAVEQSIAAMPAAGGAPWAFPPAVTRAASQLGLDALRGAIGRTVNSFFAPSAQAPALRAAAAAPGASSAPRFWGSDYGAGADGGLPWILLIAAALAGAALAVK
jgi:hypothetical protein